MKNTLIAVVLFVITAALFQCGTVSNTPAVSDPVLETVGLAGVVTMPQVVHGIRSVVEGAPNTFIVQVENSYYMAFPQGANYALVVLDDTASNVPVVEAVRAHPYSPLTLTAMLKSLKEAGGKMITPDRLPPFVLKAANDLYTWGAQLGWLRITVFVVPVTPYSNPLDLCGNDSRYICEPQ